MPKKEVETLPEKPKIKTGLPAAVENLFNQRINDEFQTIVNEIPPNINSPESALLMAQTTINDIWHKEISPILSGLFKAWGQALSNNSIESHLKKLFSDPEKLDLKIEIMYFAELIELKEILPEVWESLIRISILRQQWEMKLLANWLEKIPEERFANSGVDKAQFELALEITNELGPLFSKIYLMQMTNDYQHLLPDKIKKENNDTHSLYTVVNEQTGEEKILPLKKVFPKEIPLIIIKCQQLAQKTLEKYPEKGKLFADYLTKLALYLDSDVVEEKTATTNWEELSTLEAKLAKADWPIAMVAMHQPYITGEIKKADFDLLVGLKTNQTKEKENKYSHFAAIAQKIAAEYDPETIKTISPADINFLLFGVGANNFWRNQGSADEEALCYENSILEVNKTTILPFHQKIFQPENNNYQIDEELNNLAVISVIVHELGHTILSLAQEKFSNRLGYEEKHSELIDEIKADITGIRIFWESNPEENQAKKMLEYIVSYYASYVESSQLETMKLLTNKDEFNTDQEMAGIVISALLDVGALTKNSNGYEINNVKAGFEAIAKISDKLLKKYNDPESTPEKFRLLAKEIEKNNLEHVGFQEFIKFITK